MEGILNEINLNYLKSLRSGLDPLLRDISAFAVKGEIPVVSFEVGKFLELMTLIKNPGSVIEIGTAVGFSGIFIARALKADACLTTIEISAPSAQNARENFKRAGLMEKVRVVTGDAVKLLPEMANNNMRFDMAFIDGKKEEYAAYLECIISVMTPGGVIIIDNLLWHGQTAGGPMISDNYIESTVELQKFNRFFLKHPDLVSVILPTGDGTGMAVVK